MYTLQNLAIVLQSWFFLSVLDRRSFRTLGLWTYEGWGRELAIGTALGIAMISVVVGIQVATNSLRITGMAEAPPTAIFFVETAIFVFLAGAYEEFSFRGYAFQRLVSSFGRIGAIVVFSVLFGLAHWGNPNSSPLAVANTILAGLLLAVAYLKTRGLWLPIGLHWAWNYFLGPVFSLPVSGVRIGHPLFSVQTSGPQWLSGGNYGPEGSIVLTIVCAVGIVGLWKAPWITPSPAMRDVLK